MRKIKRSGIVAVLLMGVVFQARAIDYGAPLFKDNIDANVRVEALYNHYDRDIRLGSVDDSTDQDMYILRLDIPGEIAATYIDAGVVDDDRKDGGTPAVIGGGVRVSSYENEVMRISLLFNGHYVPEYDTKSSSGFKGNFRYYELGGGLIFSAKLASEFDEWQLVPYAGLSYSIIRGTSNVRVDPPVDGRSKLSYDVKEKDEIVGVVGIAFIINELYSIRAEADLLSDSSYSAALGVAF